MSANKYSTAIEQNNDRGKPPHSKFQQWLNSLTDSLGEVTALEINTTFVEEITKEQFIPWQVYQEIYLISRQQLQQIQIHSDLCDRYLQLRRQLELAYTLLLIDPASEFYDSEQEAQAKQNLTILSQSNSEWERLPTQLPEPIPDPTKQTTVSVFNLLDNYYFLRTLRQLATVKQSLDQQNQLLNLKNNNSPAIYAQTKIQLDGKIFNCYSQAILTHPHQSQILNLHQNSIFWGEKQWSSLFKTIINLIAKKKKI
ncbi:hypothetical protein Sta7437_3955 [Stanieria cyanosphaera PCC 7437]|uniref:Uncharacterized protein n=1 Tax=Stanieria cyanosphaera (strain ATCC 29371 / PCC 7437) TaxID=111780 RepID=K9Y0H1_STAC7|nr:hypothetical protein [Stanieria cyanosphaera]AFZ37437.1 hypothetical protein Sta7437_3955 [Stanieria cyanosphaera PCC 7437]